MDDQKLREFEVKYVTFYDGTGHRLGPAQCTLTSTRLIISDVQGGIHQIPLRDISGVSMPSRVGAPKMLRISLPGQAYDIDCVSKDQTNAVSFWIGQAIRGSLTPEGEAETRVDSTADGSDIAPQTTSTQQQIPQITSTVNPALAVIASLIIPGLGTIINRRVQRGLIILGAYIFFVILAAAASTAFFLVSAGIWIYGMIDAYQTA